MFRAVTSITTTGFSVTDPAGWRDKEKFLSSCLMVIGGTTCSTAGGIKIFRFIIMLKIVGWYFKRMLLPKETMLAVKYAGEPVIQEEINQLFGFLSFYLGMLALSSLIFTGAGFPVADSLFESASALGTVGLSSGITSPDLPGGLKFLLAFEMWAGRLEIMPVIMMLYPGVWMGLVDSSKT